MRYWIDPPSGWRYGFPKIWDKNTSTLKNFLIQNGYPEKDLEFNTHYIRCWPAKEQDAD